MAAKRNIDIGATHYEIEQSVNPDRSAKKMVITRGAWREYKCLFDYSRTARYDGFTDQETFQELKKLDHKYSLIHLEKFKLYLKSQRLDIK